MKNLALKVKILRRPLRTPQNEKKGLLMQEKELGTSWVAQNRAIIKNFPEDFLETTDVKEIKLPQDVLVLGAEMFGQYEIINSEGQAVLTADSFMKAKYILYSNRHKPKSIKMPNDEKLVKETVKKYEKYLDELLEQIKKEFEEKFPKSKQLYEVTNYIFASLNLKRY